MNLADRIFNTHLKEGEIAIFWLGQAGFVIKDSENRTIAVDPYLTDCVERTFGFKRLIPKLIAPHELEPDILIVSHDHLDHLDVDAVPIIMANNKTRLVGSVTAVEKCLGMQIDENRLIAMRPGDKAELDGIQIQAVYADHGELAPDALGIFITMGETKIYYAGDTAYSHDVVRMAAELKPDIAIVPINGEYGNLNPGEAAKLVRDSGAKVAIPCHFWTFAIHRGDPWKFEEEMKKVAPDCGLRFMQQGEMYVYGGAS